MSSNGRPPAYGPEHRRRRKVLLEQLAMIGAQPCPICGLPMTVRNRLHLDHSDPAAKARGEPGDRLVHAVCNEDSGGQLGAAIARANGQLRPGLANASGQTSGPGKPQPPPPAQPPRDKPERPSLTPEQIDARMAQLAPHNEGCDCRQRLTTHGVAGSRCW
jgi:hypothetical protein